MMNYREKYIENHLLEFDSLHSDCRECYINGLECSYYYAECRNEKGGRLNE